MSAGSSPAGAILEKLEMMLEEVRAAVDVVLMIGWTAFVFFAGLVVANVCAARSMCRLVNRMNLPIRDKAKAIAEILGKPVSWVERDIEQGKWD